MAFLYNKYYIIVLYILLAMSLGSIVGCKIQIKINTPKSSIKFIEKYSKRWQIDSIGVLGFRDQIWFHIEETPFFFNGVEWDRVKDYFGKPNHEAKSYVKDAKTDHLNVYYYFCTYNHLRSDGFSKIGASEILIEVNPVTNRIYRIRKIYRD